MTIRIFPDLSAVAFDDKGRAVPDLNVSVLDLFCAYAAKKGHDLSGKIAETPDGECRMMKTPGGTWTHQRV